MRKLVRMTAFVVLLFAFAAPAALADNANGNKLQCFSGTTDPGTYGGTCVLAPDGTATLHTAVAGNDYAGVYLQNTNLDGKPLSIVNQLGFTYAGSAAGAGAPRISLPVDTTGSGATGLWMYLSAFYCNDGTGKLDALNDATCTIWLSNGASYANWAALVAAHPSWRVATDNVSFVIVDEPGHWTVSDVRLGRGPARAAKG